MACYCPHIRCFDCNNYGHVTADCPDKIPPSGMPAQHSNNTSSRHDRVSISEQPHHHVPTMTIEADTDSAGLNRAHTIPDIEVTVVVIPTEAILYHFINPQAIAPYITEVPAHTASAMTHNIAEPHLIDIYPEKTVDPEHLSPAGN